MTNTHSVLLVEDDASLADWIAEFLAEHDFSVVHVERGDQVLPVFNDGHFDIVLLDVMLPGMNGIEACRQLRQQSDIPVLIMSARGDEYDEVMGLEAGANDYVIKPVRPRALLARINALLSVSRRQNDTSQLDLLTFGALELNRHCERVRWCGEEIELSSGLFEFLWFLATHSGQIVSRETVFQNLRGFEYDGIDRRFDVMLSNLRRAFGDDPQHPQKLKTVWGKGYLFVPDAWAAPSYEQSV
ncbi:response regulator transcription factor [Corallincola spongiicola]|uniref:Response regulator transcription factor n=1 Tax=Corallincola spongiicola TaxID=2520508 RepID=A0ABY1WUD3_9GAMM|nr:response regulator transcription factor [Corallincola spongiicola]TAA48342.1 response regulator transcription factor [Corallincola spongiicola]